MRLLHPNRQRNATLDLVSGNRAEGLLPGRVFQDELLNRLVGGWVMKGSVRGRPMVCRLRAKWVLNHQFLRLNVRHQAYHATVYIGYDHVSERYVAHWMDVFGSRVSQTLGFGQRLESGLHFVFEYPTGPSHASMNFDAHANRWNLLITERHAGGAPYEFAHFAIRPRPRVRRVATPSPLVIRQEHNLAG